MENLIGLRIGSLYVINQFESTVICYCSNCRRNNIEFADTKIKELIGTGKYITCGCEIKEKKEQSYNIKLGTKFSYLTVVKVLENNKYECRCLCGKLEIVDEMDLKNNKIIKCNSCKKTEDIYKKSNLVLYNNRVKKELYYIWTSYKELYNKPNSKFKEEIIKKKINFFMEFEDSFELFLQWATLNGFGNNGCVFLDRKDINKDFSTSNCFWTRSGKDNFVQIPTRNIEHINPSDELMQGKKIHIKQGKLNKKDLIIAKNENKPEVKVEKQKLIQYFKFHYGIQKISVQVNNLLKILNNGLGADNIAPVKIEYSKLLTMFKYYEKTLANNHKKMQINFNDENAKLYYDIMSVLNNLDEYDANICKNEEV